MYVKSVIEMRQCKATIPKDSLEKKRAASGRTRTRDMLHTMQMLTAGHVHSQGKGLGLRYPA